MLGERETRRNAPAGLDQNSNTLDGNGSKGRICTGRGGRVRSREDQRRAKIRADSRKQEKRTGEACANTDAAPALRKSLRRMLMASPIHIAEGSREVRGVRGWSPRRVALGDRCRIGSLRGPSLNCSDVGMSPGQQSRAGPIPAREPHRAGCRFRAVRRR